MNLKELQFPVRVYWDLPASNNSIEQLLVCQELIKNRILSVHMTAAGFHPGGASIGVLERLDKEQIAVSLTLTKDSAGSFVIESLHRLKIGVLFFGVSSLDEARNTLIPICHSEPNISVRRSARPTSLGISFDVSNDNVTELPSLISFCVRQGIKDLVIPIKRLAGKRECFYLTSDLRSMLAEKLKGINAAELRLAMHDPFLWSVLNPSVSLPAAGCEAGNSMFYISSAGDVYPCPSLPVKLGNINNDNLANILSCSAKLDLRKHLSSAPSECNGCGEVRTCMGGCRGRALVLKGSLDFADPACNMLKSF